VALENNEAVARGHRSRLESRRRARSAQRCVSRAASRSDKAQASFEWSET
jgi:hypothetical protein